MMKNEIIDSFEKGNLFSVSGIKDICEADWVPHKKFSGVSLKNLIVASESSGEISYHIVRVEPGCELSTHTHENNMEIHEIISGSGTLYLDKTSHEYLPGNICVIPKNVVHKVVAGGEGLYLFAKFMPAIL